MKSEEEYQDAIELNHEQKLAFAALERSVKRCKEANIYFYQCLESLAGLNGNNVRVVEDGGTSDAPNGMQFKYYPTVNTTCSFADDNHYVVLHDE